MSMDFSIFEIFATTINSCKSLLKEIILEKLEDALKEINIQLSQLNESILYESHLFSILLGGNKEMPLNQVVVGYLIDTQKNDTQKNILSFQAKSDAFGKIYLPNLGYIQTDNSSTVSINYNAKSHSVSLHKTKECPIIKDILIDGKIKCYTHISKTTQNKIIITENPTETLSKSIITIKNSFEFLKNENNVFYKAIISVINSLFVYNQSNHNSFADISHHGTIFLNTLGNYNSEAYFIDDISHQSGHVIFNLLTLNTKDYLKVSRNTLIKEVIPHLKDDRNIYSIFHGLFTYSCILISLRKYILSNQKQSDEALARIGFYLGKMCADLNITYKAGFLTKKGNQYYDKFLEIYKEFYDEYASTFKNIKYANQPYVFDYKKYKEIN